MKFVEINLENESEYCKMYSEYKDVLRGYDCTIPPSSPTEAKLRLNLYNSKVYLLEHSQNIVGFIILGFGLGISFSRHDIHIEEFFIRPEYQKMGLGSLAIIELIKKYPEQDFSLFILENNDIARIFWEIMFARCGFMECTGAQHIFAKSENLFFKYYTKLPT